MRDYCGDPDIIFTLSWETLYLNAIIANTSSSKTCGGDWPEDSLQDLTLFCARDHLFDLI
jgi:hypothetical protein